MANVSSSNGLEKRPKLRFPGFDEPWKKSEFREFAEVNPKCQSIPEQFYYIDLGSVEDGELNNTRIEDVLSAPSRAQRLLSRNDILFQTVRPYQQNNYLFCEDRKLPTVASTGYAVFRTQYDVQFLYALIHTKHFLSSVLSRCTGTSFPAVSASDIEDIIIWAPSVDEQQEIGELFRLLNVKIRKQKALVEALKKYKRGAIAHILSGKDSEFAGEAIWAEKTLSDLCCEFRSGRSISATLIHESGDYPVYGGNGIRGYCDHYSHEGEYVVVGRQGALCGNVRLIRGQNYLSEHAIAVRANEENDTKFLLYLLDFMNLGQYSDQGAQPGLAVNKLLRLKCNVPEKKIQSKISAFLLTYDKQIAFQESILSLLTAQRKAFLQQLFI